MGLPKSVVHDQLPSEIQKQLEFLRKAGPFGMLGSLSVDKGFGENLSRITEMEAANRKALEHMFEGLQPSVLGTKTFGENLSWTMQKQASVNLAAFARMEETLKPILKAQEHFQKSFGHLTSDLAIAQLAWRESAREWELLQPALNIPGVFAGIKAVQLQMDRIAEHCQASSAIESSIVRASLRNLEALNSLQAARLDEISTAGLLPLSLVDLPIAAGFVVEYNQFLPSSFHRRGALRIQDEIEFEDGWKAEEIGSRLDKELDKIDRRFVELRRRAWELMAKSGSAVLRLAAHGMRELFDEVLRALVSDEAIITSTLWLNREDCNLNRPTRPMRIKFLLGTQPERLETLLQFGSSLKKAQGYAHSFPEDRELVRVYLSELERYIYLLLVYAKRQ